MANVDFTPPPPPQQQESCQVKQKMLFFKKMFFMPVSPGLGCLRIGTDTGGCTESNTPLSSQNFHLTKYK
jgi:hypothetical protein